MNILQICKKMPVPAKDGEALAILNMINLHLLQKTKLTLLALATQKHPGNLANLPNKIKTAISYSQITINTNFKLWALVKSIFNKRAYTLYRFYSKDFETLIIQTLQTQNFDIIQLEGLYLLSYINTFKKHSKAKIVLRAHNVEHHVWQNLANNHHNFFKKCIYRFNANSLKPAEEKAVQQVDALVTISTADQTYFNQHQHIPSLNMPFGIDVNNYTIAKNETNSLSLSFIGSLDWLPNIEALHWFIDQVLPTVIEQFPDVQFHIAGRNMQSSIQKLNNPNVVIEGEVDCAKKFIGAHPVFVVPLLSGSGMRIKIIEAMALQTAVISTPLGASGIQFTHQSNILIAKTALEFSNSILSLLKNEARRKKIAQNGRQLVEKHHNNVTLSKSLYNFYRTLLP